MRWTRYLASLVFLHVGAAIALAQTEPGRITGTVTESASGRGVADANVVIVGSRVGTRTDTAGAFSLATVAPGRYLLRVARIGFAAATDSVVVASGQTATANIQLRQVSVTLDQMVVVGYGSQRRSDLTGSVASVTPSVETTPINSLEQTLQGTAPGVQVTTASSAPGGGISIRIRGGSSVNGNNEPLYVIDGFPIENDPTNSDPTNAGRTNTAPSNPLATLNPSDIASIEILKDASATAIYGARGANGVVIITTKSGSGATPRVTLDSYVGMQNVAKRYDLLNATQYAQFANEYAAAVSQPAPYADPTSLGTGTDWQRQIFRQAPIRNLQLGVSGGGNGLNATHYALSGGVFDQQGVVIGSAFRRLSLRGNVDQSVGSRLKLGSNLLVSRINSSQVPTDGTFNGGAGAVGAALQYIPVLPVRKGDGSYTLLQTDFPNELAALSLGPANVPNPVSMAADVTDNLGDTRVLANALGEYTILNGLTLRSTLGTDISNRTRDTYYPRTTLQGLTRNGQALRGTIYTTSWLNENTLNYDREIGTAQHVTVVGGYSRQALNSTRENITNSNFVSDITGYENIGAGSQAGGPSVGSGRTRWTLASYLGRVNYTLFDRYLFTVTGREDGSSRFGVNHRWGFFPSVAFGWRLSDEPFLRDVSQIQQIKLRASWGVAGNPSISPYQSLNRLSAQQYTFNGTLAPGYVASSLGNENLSWESTKQTDLGADIGLWNGRLDMTADWYNKRTDDLLLGIDLPSESGYSTALVNAGAIRNRGFELSLTLRPLTGTNPGSVNWTTTVNYSRNRNVVLGLGDVDQIFAAQSIAPDLGTQGTLVQVGQPLGAFYGYKTSGIFRDSTEVAAYTKTTRLSSGTISPGQVRIVDVNNDGVINADDRTIIGDPNPLWTGGWQNTLTYRGFSLTALVDGTYGNKVLNLNLYRLYGASPSTNISTDRWLNRWTPDNPNAKYPRINSTPVAIGADFTDAVLEDGSFTRLRTVTFSHEIPTHVLRTNLNGGRIYVTGQNLYTWTKYSGFNPDVSSQGVGNLNRGIDLGSYPLARTYIFGINLNY
jgi:TonB-linked SusC/RagA family outer membrane protein